MNKRKYYWPQEPNLPVLFPFIPKDKELAGTGYTAATRICNAANIRQRWYNLPFRPRIRTTSLGIKFWWELKES